MGKDEEEQGNLPINTLFKIDFALPYRVFGCSV